MEVIELSKKEEAILANKVEPPLVTQPEFNSKPVEPVEPVKKKVKASPRPCPVCGEIILGRAMGHHVWLHKVRKDNGKALPDAPPQASVTQGAALPAKQVVSDGKTLYFTDLNDGKPLYFTVLPLLPPYQDVPPDCRAVWFEIYAELVRK
jgi:hypothetical protein